MPLFEHWEQDLADAVKHFKVKLEPMSVDPGELDEKKWLVKKGKTTLGTLTLNINETLLEDLDDEERELYEAEGFDEGDGIETQEWECCHRCCGVHYFQDDVHDALQWLIDRESQFPQDKVLEFTVLVSFDKKPILDNTKTREHYQKMYDALADVAAGFGTTGSKVKRVLILRDQVVQVERNAGR
jgi:hypothetical protein